MADDWTLFVQDSYLFVCHGWCMAPNDRLAPLLDRFRIRAHLFHTGPLCGMTAFDAQPGRGFLHVLRRGEMGVTHRDPGARPQHIQVDEPSLLFYPRPLDHAFHNAPTEDSDFACATLDVGTGSEHPLMRALPPVIVLPLDTVPTLAPSLDLLFAEVDQARCGDRLLIDRLFEVVLIQLFRWLFDHVAELGMPRGLLAGLADPELAPVLTAMHEHPEYAWSIERLASEARMGRSAFAERFKRVVGETPANYLADWRILIAQDLLRRGNPVGHVASEVGYATTPAFSRAFAQRVGQSPREWAASKVAVVDAAGTLD